MSAHRGKADLAFAGRKSGNDLCEECDGFAVINMPGVQSKGGRSTTYCENAHAEAAA
jgi:hypothetical protein